MVVPKNQFEARTPLLLLEVEARMPLLLLKVVEARMPLLLLEGRGKDASPTSVAGFPSGEVDGFERLPAPPCEM
jgi:hypothetical protein